MYYRMYRNHPLTIRATGYRTLIEFVANKPTFAIEQLFTRSLRGRPSPDMIMQSNSNYCGYCDITKSRNETTYTLLLPRAQSFTVPYTVVGFRRSCCLSHVLNH